MTVSHFRVAKTETRDLAERDRIWQRGSRFGEPTEWRMSNAGFFSAFVVIAAVLAMIALVLR